LFQFLVLIPGIALQEAVKIAFKVKMKREPSTQEITDMAKLFTPKKLIYIEMVK